MNDVPLNKKKINMFKGEFSTRVSDRAYMYEEIKKLLDISDLRMKSIIFLMTSSGVRIGSLPLLKLRNLEKIDSIYKIIVYEGTNSILYFVLPNAHILLMLIYNIEYKKVRD